MAAYTNLDNEIFATASLEAFTKVLAPFARFSKNFSAAPSEKGANILVPLVAALTATTFGGSYVTTMGSKTVVTVALTGHKVIIVGQTDLEAANSSAASLESFAYQQGAALGLEVLKDVLTLVTTANFAASSASGAAYDVAALRAVRLLLSQNDVPDMLRCLLLDCVPMDALLGVTNFVQKYAFAQENVATDGKIARAYGFDFYELNNLFLGGAASVMGFAAHPAAIAIAMRYLAPQDGNTYSYAAPVSDPVTGLVFGLRDFFDNATGTRYRAMECNYGRAVGLTTAGRVIKRTDA